MRQFMRQLIPSMFHRRLVMLATLALFVLAAMLAQLAHLTVVRSEALRERAESLLVTREFVPSRRGEIVDRHGRTLARDRLSYHVNVHYSLISGRWAYRQAERHAMREHRRRWPELSRRERDRLAERYRPQYERVVRQFWEDLAMATGTPLAEIESHKNDVLLRVAQIRGSVIARRMQREREQYEMPVSSANVAQPIGEEVMGHPVVFDIDRDVRRARIMRQAAGAEARVMVDANQQWTVAEAIEFAAKARELDLYWIEEPTHPDDCLGHAHIARAIAPVKVATGEHLPNRVVFKNYLQAGAMAFCQVDAVRVAGVSEFLVVSMLARASAVPVVPHVGDMGQLHQHLVLFNHIGLGHEVVFLEHIPHLRAHFAEPVELTAGRYRCPDAPGASCRLLPAD